ncbi:hypothetical protein Pan97_07370 [Bremerella volcania]|uniref:Uncharacterized protein n=1 Tax=Bremerella volcania TaxID=2527984 RepID=A0A518C3D4_9BACT|nr:hypothetical protein Pan97_07370 [Bremerella volcania]
MILVAKHGFVDGPSAIRLPSAHVLIGHGLFRAPIPNKELNYAR